jgi:hypothetical protein
MNFIDVSLEWLSNWFLLISIFTVFPLLPFSILLYYQTNCKRLAAVLFICVCGIGIINAVDMIFWQFGRRPFSSGNELILSWVMPNKYQSIPLIDIPLNDCKTNFCHKYRGEYAVGILIRNNENSASFVNDYDYTKYKISVKGSMKCANSNNIEPINSYEEGHGSFVNQQYRFIVHKKYEIPSIFPNDKIINVEIEVLGDKMNFLKQYPNARLQIRKMMYK